mmetsp:Transcript_20350/g.56600  ORF Transcript_20350/g.56600 Transcript_20350/m.56600 type:complete len:283 (-) Transcript_20350:431-1279(-)
MARSSFSNCSFRSYEARSSRCNHGLPSLLCSFSSPLPIETNSEVPESCPTSAAEFSPLPTLLSKLLAGSFAPPPKGACPPAAAVQFSLLPPLSSDLLAMGFATTARIDSATAAARPSSHLASTSRNFENLAPRSVTPPAVLSSDPLLQSLASSFRCAGRTSRAWPQCLSDCCGRPSATVPLECADNVRATTLEKADPMEGRASRPHRGPGPASGGGAPLARGMSWDSTLGSSSFVPGAALISCDGAASLLPCPLPDLPSLFDASFGTVDFAEAQAPYAAHVC